MLLCYGEMAHWLCSDERCMKWQATSPYLSGVPGVGSTYAQYYTPQLVPAMLGHDPAAAAASPLGVMQQPVLQQKLPRTDRLEVR